MDTNTLQKILNKHYPNLNGIVCAKDELSDIIGHRKAYIINTDPSNKPGEHWVCIYYLGNSAFYFDSFGIQNNIESEIKNFLSHTCHTWCRNRNSFQAEDSELCGVYCLFVLHILYNGYNVKSLNQIFNAQPKLNDAKVFKWFTTLFAECLQTPNNEEVYEGCCPMCSNVVSANMS